MSRRYAPPRAFLERAKDTTQRVLSSGAYGSPAIPQLALVNLRLDSVQRMVSIRCLSTVRSYSWRTLFILYSPHPFEPALECSIGAQSFGLFCKSLEK